MDVNQQHIEHPDSFLSEVLLSVLPIERKDGDACLLVHFVRHYRSRIGSASETVFGREDGRHPYALFHKHVKHMPVVFSHQPGLVAEQSYTFSLDERQVELSPLVTSYHTLCYFRYMLRRKPVVHAFFPIIAYRVAKCWQENK